jgi:hypothetical protein
MDGVVVRELLIFSTGKLFHRTNLAFDWGAESDAECAPRVRNSLITTPEWTAPARMRSAKLEAINLVFI